MINELKPCPFCGGKAKYKCDMKIIPIYDADGTYIDADIGDYTESVHCIECGAEIYCIEEGDGVAVEKWNKRRGEYIEKESLLEELDRIKTFYAGDRDKYINMIIDYVQNNKSTII